VLLDTSGFERKVSVLDGDIDGVWELIIALVKIIFRSGYKEV